MGDTGRLALQLFGRLLPIHAVRPLQSFSSIRTGLIGNAPFRQSVSPSSFPDFNASAMILAPSVLLVSPVLCTSARTV